MADLISRAAAIEWLDFMIHFYDEKTSPVHHRVLVDVREGINEMDAVDAVPVAHSRWKQTDAYPHWLYCLNCYKRIVPNVEWVEEYSIPTNYCPHCGARMDGEADA